MLVDRNFLAIHICKIDSTWVFEQMQLKNMIGYIVSWYYSEYLQLHMPITVWVKTTTGL